MLMVSSAPGTASGFRNRSAHTQQPHNMHDDQAPQSDDWRPSSLLSQAPWQSQKAGLMTLPQSKSIKTKYQNSHVKKMKHEKSYAQLVALTYFRVVTLALALWMASTLLYSSHHTASRDHHSARNMMEMRNNKLRKGENQHDMTAAFQIGEDTKLIEEQHFVQMEHRGSNEQNHAHLVGDVASFVEDEDENEDKVSDEIRDERRSPKKENTDGSFDDHGRYNYYDHADEQHSHEMEIDFSSFGYSSREEMDDRHKRFPSVDERVQLLMTNWYLPPCANEHVKKIPDEDAYVEYNYVYNATSNADVLLFQESRTWREKIRGPLRHFLVDESTDYDQLRFMSKRDTLLDCDNSYCTDLVKYLFPAMDRAPADATPVPVLFQFSDAEKTRGYILEKGKSGAYPNVPHLKKFRFALSKEERERVVGADQGCSTVPRNIPKTRIQQQELQEDPQAKIIAVAQPIVFKLTVDRHFGPVPKIPSKDKPWSEKKDQAIFRGQFTGRFPNNMSGSDIEKLSAHEQCQLLRRCRLVYNSAAPTTTKGTSSVPLVDAKLALPILDVRKDFPRTLDGIELFGKRVSIEEMLTYKAIIMLEGNDVSSGLKWALYSNSVVMTPTPTLTSWAMEELLEPWVHYVPLANDLSDVHEKMQWILDNDLKAQEIAIRGKLWISDLIFHPEAEQDEERIFDEILWRYRSHFRLQPTMRLEEFALEK